MSAWLVRLIRLFPAAFREHFGAEMAEQVRRDHARAREAGPLSSAWFTLATSFDLVRAALAERLAPTWARSQPPTPGGRGMRWTLNEWARDLRHAARALRRSPGFTIVTASTLGLAIGANAGMFSVVNRVLLDPLPYAHADRLLYVAASAPGSDLPAEFGIAAEFFVQYREQSKLIEDAAVYQTGTSTLRTADRVERVRMGFPSYNLFATLGVAPVLGRLPVAEDESRVALISYGLWQSWFGGDSAVIGRTYDISGASRTVIGVMGPEFAFPVEGTMVWVPYAVRAERITPGRFGSGDLVARVRPGTSTEALAAELTTLARRLPERFGGSAAYARVIAQHKAVVRPLEDQLLGAAARPLWVLLGSVTIVLLIACANVANLFLVRTEGRQRDLAVRRAIGAARSQLIRLQISESIVVAALAGAVAGLLATVGLPAFLRAAPAGIPRLAGVHFDLSTLGFTVGAAFLSALACGIVPALRASSPDLTRLREGGRGATRRRRWARDLLVVAQTALALVLLIGSGLLIRSFSALRHVNPGYSTDDIFTFQIAPEGPHLTDGPAFARFDLAFLDRLAALPGVQSVGLVENVPLNEGTAIAPFRTEEMSTDPSALIRVAFTWTAGDYFKTMGIRMSAGRGFTADDHLSAAPVAIVSRSAASKLWPGKDPIGRRLQTAGDSTWATVVGVVDDVMQYGFRDTPQPLVYYPLVGPTPQSWRISSPAYVVKTTRAETIAPEIRALAREVAPTAPMYRVFTMAGLARDSMVQLSFTMLTLGILSALALILGAVGLYGVLSYVVAERTREIGVRMALGARADQVRRMVVSEGARVVAIGIGIGIAVALGSTRLLGGLLFGVRPLDATTFVAMSASMVLIGFLASYLPARRASRVDPIESLRGD